jgi:hypothetical protein
MQRNLLVISLRVGCAVTLAFLLLTSTPPASDGQQRKSIPKRTAKKQQGKLLPKPQAEDSATDFPHLPIEEQQRLATLKQQVEKELRAWRREQKNLSPPVGELLCKDAELAGVWGTGSGFSVVTFTILPKARGLLSVNFETGGCEGGWKLLREGRYDAGILTLNKPIKIYPDGIFDRLYTMRVAGKEFLVPDLYLADFQQGLIADGGKIGEKTRWTCYCKNP